MSSTRNNNSAGDYALQQQQYNLARVHIHAPYRKSYHTSLVDLGYNPDHLPREELSQNPIDIESKLMGIGSSNLVSAQPTVYPSLKHLPTHSYFNRTPMVMPKRLVVEPNQRPSLW
jgi:hypothetical protein